MKENSKIKLSKILLLFSPLLFFLLIYFSVKLYDYYILVKHKKTTTGVITKVSFSGIRNEFEVNNVEYEYFVGNIKYKGYTSSKLSYNYVISDIGIPIIPSHEYIVYYSEKNHTLSKIDFTKPTKNTIEKFIEETSSILAKYNKFKKCTNNNLKELVKSLINIYGLNVVADIYCHQEPLVENLRHNKKTFEKLINNKKVDSLINVLCLKSD
ncbi:MAG: hypothetical protein N3A01_05455 [Bacteroidales bacterium]|nr:hypothetical protein [Bacteroidales bacterium]